MAPALNSGFHLAYLIGAGADDIASRSSPRYVIEPVAAPSMEPEADRELAGESRPTTRPDSYFATSPVDEDGSPAAPPIAARSPSASTRKPLIDPSPELSE